MKMTTKNKTYAVTDYTPRGADGCVIVCGEPPGALDVLRVKSDDGMILNEYTVADYLRCEVDGNRIELTNMPAPPPAPPPEPAKPTEQEQQRADIDFLAAMVGVTL